MPFDAQRRKPLSVAAAALEQLPILYCPPNQDSKVAEPGTFHQAHHSLSQDHRTRIMQHHKSFCTYPLTALWKPYAVMSKSSDFQTLSPNPLQSRLLVLSSSFPGFGIVLRGLASLHCGIRYSQLNRWPSRAMIPSRLG